MAIVFRDIPSPTNNDNRHYNAKRCRRKNTVPVPEAHGEDMDKLARLFTRLSDRRAEIRLR